MRGSKLRGAAPSPTVRLPSVGHSGPRPPPQASATSAVAHTSGRSRAVTIVGNSSHARRHTLRKTALIQNRAARWVLAAGLALGGITAAPPAAAGQPAAAQPAAAPRVVILGFDGADAELAQRWMDEGKLPNLARLAAQGTFAPLRSTVPSQTPVSWSTFSTGLNPGRHCDLRLPEARHRRPTARASPPSTRAASPFLWGERNAAGSWAAASPWPCSCSCSRPQALPPGHRRRGG